MAYLVEPDYPAEAYPCLTVEAGVYCFPDWPELQRVEGKPDLALSRAVRLRRLAGLLMPYPSMLSTLDAEKTVMVGVLSDEEAIEISGVNVEEEDG